MNIFNIFKRPVPEPVFINWQELYQQSGENVRYLKAHISVLNASIEDLKNRSARGSREKILKLTSTRDWMTLKLREEEVDHLRFKNNSSTIFAGQTK